jgi:copper chaperone CopZ
MVMLTYCSHCVNNIVMALKDIGAKDMDVNLDKKVAIAEISENIQVLYKI